MDDRDKALHKFLNDLDKFELIHIEHQGDIFMVNITPGPHTAVQSDEADEVTDELLEATIAFLDACKSRKQEAIESKAKVLEGAIDLQVTTDFLTEHKAHKLIGQLQDIADGSKWTKIGSNK